MWQPSDLPTEERDAWATLEALEETVLRRRRAEVDDLELVLHWADLHSAVQVEVPRPRRRGEPQLVECAGEGTPGVSDLAMSELGIARGVHTLAARAVTADALDLKFRLPHVWALLRDLAAEVWIGRRVAKMTRHLPYEAVGLVDAAVAETMAGHSPARVFEVCEAKIIEADPAAHQARLEEELKKRFVGLTRINPYGMQTFIARNPAGDVDDLITLIDSVADALAPRPEYDGCSRDELRAEALVWIGRPEDVLELLHPEEPGEEPRPTRSTRKPATLFVHLHEAALTGAASGVARVEGLGPHSLAQLRRLLGGREVTVVPVLDLAEAVATNAYEHPEAIKTRIHLLRPGSGFPHATCTSRTVDLDHPLPYDPEGPPGQTSSHTSQPLTRSEHRAKTHLNYQAQPRGPGVTWWRTPHGLTRIVDHRGTHRIGPGESAMELDLASLLHRCGGDPAVDGCF